MFCLVGGFNPAKKNISQLGLLFPTEWKNRSHVPNHQPDYIVIPIINHYWPIPLKNMSSSVEMMTFPTEWKVIFQTTNQVYTYTLPSGKLT